MSFLNNLLSGQALLILVGSLLLIFGVNGYSKYRSTLNAIRNHPGYRLLLFPTGMASNMLPRIPGVSMGQNWVMILKHRLFADMGRDILSFVWIAGGIRAGYFIADPVTIKEITLHRARFPKPLEQYTVLTFFGDNIVTTEDDEWKKHRKIAAPPFSERNNKLVWDESVRVTLEMFQGWGIDKLEVVIDHGVNITLPFALLVISVAAFGRRISWGEDTVIPAGHKMSFKDALHVVSVQVFLKLIAPNWAYPFSKTLRHVQECLDELQLYMQEMITDRRAATVKEERYDLFSALLEANDQDGEKTALSDQELIGNIFIFLIAGHETTAHTLCFTLGLLAIHQEEQEKVYQQVASLVPEGQNPTYDQMNAFTYALAVLYETLRLFPPVPNVPKYSVEDTTLPHVQPDGSMGSLSVPKDTTLVLSAIGVHYNPRCWPDPTEFKPSRFLGDWSKDAFLPFSSGPRACLGRRFSETESIAMIVMVVHRYRIELRDRDQYEGLTPFQKREKLLANRPGITTTPLSVPLVFKRR